MPRTLEFENVWNFCFTKKGKKHQKLSIADKKKPAIRFCSFLLTDIFLLFVSFPSPATTSTFRFFFFFHFSNISSLCKICQKLRFSLNRIFLHYDRIYDFVLIRENAGQRKPEYFRRFLFREYAQPKIFILV